MKDLGLSADLLKSVSGIMKDTSAKQAEQSKVVSEKLAGQYASKMGVARPRSEQDAKLATYESRAPQRRVTDTITQMYTKSVAEHNARAKEEAAAIEKAYGKLGASKPISESVDEACSSKMKAAKKEFKKAEEEKLKSRTVKARDAVDEGKKVDVEKSKEPLPFTPDKPKKNPSAVAGKYGQGYSTARHLARQGIKDVTKEEVEQVDEKEYVMPFNSKKTTSAGDRYKSVIAHAKKMGYKVHHQDTAGDEKGDADITVRYQGGESRHSSDPESIEVHKGSKAHGDKALHAMAKGTASAVKEDVEQIDELEKSTLKSYMNKALSDDNYNKRKNRPADIVRAMRKVHAKTQTEEVTLSAEEITRIEELAKQFEEQNGTN